MKTVKDNDPFPTWKHPVGFARESAPARRLFSEFEQLVYACPALAPGSFRSGQFIGQAARPYSPRKNERARSKTGSRPSR